VVNVGKARVFRRKDGKYLIYLPLDLATDSMFPFRTETSVRVKVSFKIGEKKLIIEPLEKKLTKDDFLRRFQENL
jgi:hypothetical protein